MRARLVAFGLTLAARAFADQQQPIRVEYRAPEGCSSHDGFVSEVLSRTPRVRLALSGEASAAFMVELTRDANGVSGSLLLEEVDGRRTERSLHGVSCEEVVPALAFIAAILVDPEAATRAPGAAPVAPSTTPGAAPAAATTAAVAAASEKPAPPPAKPAPQPAPPAAPPPAAKTSPSSPPSAPSRFRFGGGGGLSVDTSVSPDVTLSPFAELDVARVDGDERLYSFGVAFQRVTSETTLPGGTASFTWTAGRGFFCPFSLPDRGLVSFLPCGAFQAGTLKAEGETAVTRPWFTLGPLARLELHPIRYLVLFVEAEGVFALSHPTFYFAPETEVFSVPVAGLATRIGLRGVIP